MTKTFARPHLPNSPLSCAPAGTRALLLSFAFLFTTACGDDFSEPVTNTTDEDSSSFDSITTTPTPTTTNPRPTTTTTADETSDSDGPKPPAPHDGDASADETKPTPPDGPSSDEMPGRNCGGEGQACCDENKCKRGLTCGGTTDAGATEALVCTRDGDAPPPPAHDGDAEAPPPPPAHDGDASAPEPPPPPAHDGDAAAPPGPPGPPPPPAHDGDAAAPPGPPGPPAP